MVRRVRIWGGSWRRVALLGVILVVGLVGWLPVAQAQTAQARPFILPFNTPPGPDTWLLGQPYGNTTGAYRQRFSAYGASQGIHFGLDMSAPCGTEFVAIGDGVVFGVDQLQFGAGPHNVVIDHASVGVASHYGHLLQRSTLQRGQAVKAGQVIGLVGDENGRCTAGPHLHLEIRNLQHVRKYNPMLYIQADWDNLTLVGSGPRTFQRNLDNPRQWQHLNDQPEAVTGGPLLNDFPRTWPPSTTGGR